MLSQAHVVQEQPPVKFRSLIAHIQTTMKAMSRLYVSLHHRSTHRRALCHSVTKALVVLLVVAAQRDLSDAS
jgi:hypothetical protein